MSADMISVFHPDWSHHRSPIQSGLASSPPLSSFSLSSSPPTSSHHQPGTLWQSRNSFGWDMPHASTSATDLHPSWKIWGPISGSKATLGGLSEAACATYSPGNHDTIGYSATSYGSVGSAGSAGSTSSLWFGSTTQSVPIATRSSGGLSSPPLTPQTSPGLSQYTRPLGPSTLAGVLRPIATHSAAHSKVLTTVPENHRVPVQLPSSVTAQDIPAFEELVTALSSTTKPLCFVLFKSGRLDVFTISEKTALPVSVGDLVIVDADRGRDLGKLVAENVSLEEAAHLKWQQHCEQRLILHQCATTKDANMPLATCTPKHVLRVAHTSEVQPLAAKSAAEAKAVAFCNQKVHERGLDMSIVDAEYQWDRRKLTFFYKSDQRVDFRDLVRELFRTYKTRIWMCAVASQ